MPAFSKRRLAVLGVAVAAAAALFLLARWRTAASALTPARFVQTQSEIGTVEFSHDGRLVMTVSREKIVTFWDPATGHIVRQWPGGGGQTWLSDNGQRFLEADLGTQGPTRCTLRDAVTGRALRQWTGRILDVLPDFSLMVTSDDYLPPTARQVCRQRAGLSASQPGASSGDSR